MIQKTDALVLKKLEYRDTSFIVTLYTRDFGKIVGLIKGIRVPKLRYASWMEIFSLNEVVFYEHPARTIYTIAECELKDYFPNLRTELLKIGTASYFMELVNSLTPLHDRDSASDIFDLTVGVLKALSQGNPVGDKSPTTSSMAISNGVKLITRAFEIKLLKHLGMMPNFKTCVCCNRRWKGVYVYFSLPLGGIVCNRCLSNDPGVHKINNTSLRVLNYISKVSLSAASRMKIDDRIHEDIKDIIFDFIRYHLHKGFNSMEFLRKVANDKPDVTIFKHIDSCS